ncbi:MAG: hypothetical protein BWY63_01203 [Chloroflexi bacterium ADurb.Bin360]|nr:MAG: hypothetical protein BWY63_01203 [Chloroflexi bacterium ADurb.Bin360]
MMGQWFGMQSVRITSAPAGKAPWHTSQAVPALWGVFAFPFSIDKIRNPSKIVPEPQPCRCQPVIWAWPRLSGFWTALQDEVFGGKENFHASIQNCVQMTPLGAIPHDAIAGIDHDVIHLACDASLF